MRIDWALLGAALLLGASPSAAAPLEPAACAALKTEYNDLVAGGSKQDMDRGPEWAKANLAPERLGKIERLIGIEEQLSFRCDSQKTARPVLKEQPKITPDKPDATGAKSAALGKGMPTNMPLPKRKDMTAATRAASARKESAGN